jgi:hypothetical protein
LVTDKDSKRGLTTLLAVFFDTASALSHKTIGRIFKETSFLLVEVASLQPSIAHEIQELSPRGLVFRLLTQ